MVLHPLGMDMGYLQRVKQAAMYCPGNRRTSSVTLKM